jgi:hypothetical protein
VVHAQFPDEYDRGHWPYVDQALLLDYGDIDRLLPLVRALHEAYPFQAAVSLFELGLLPTAWINEALGSAASPSPPWNRCWTSGGCAGTWPRGAAVRPALSAAPPRGVHSGRTGFLTWGWNDRARQ